jgi:hypothetical protein
MRWWRRWYTRARMNARPLSDRILAALLWASAFCFATGVFLSLTLFFPSLPPTKPVAIGLVTVLRYSKLKDYLGIGLFFPHRPAAHDPLPSLRPTIHAEAHRPGDFVSRAVPPRAVFLSDHRQGGLDRHAAARAVDPRAARAGRVGDEALAARHVPRRAAAVSRAALLRGDLVDPLPLPRHRPPLRAHPDALPRSHLHRRDARALLARRVFHRVGGGGGFPARRHCRHSARHPPLPSALLDSDHRAAAGHPARAAGQRVDRVRASGTRSRRAPPGGSARS